MPDAVDLVRPDTLAAYDNMFHAGREFKHDALTLAAFALAADPADIGDTLALFDAHNSRGEDLAGKTLLAAWSAGLDRIAAAEFGSVIGYLAGLEIVETHCAAGNRDREFVEAASWGFEDSFAQRFAALLLSTALDTPHVRQ